MKTLLRKTTYLLLVALLVPLTAIALNAAGHYRATHVATSSHATLAPEPLPMPDP